MARNSRILALTLVWVLISALRAGAKTSPDGIWSEPGGSVVETTQSPLKGRTPWVTPSRFLEYSLNGRALEQLLSRAPLERLDLKSESRPTPARIDLPTPDGGYAAFEFVESPVMEADLAAKFPGIRTYTGRNCVDPSSTVRFDRTPAGFHAQVLAPGRTWYIDPYRNAETYACYYKRDYRRGEKAFDCLAESSGIRSLQRVSARSGDTLRTFRLAVASTGEYAQFHGGTIEAAMGAIVTSVNRVTGIYEQELAIRFTLVSGNDELIHLDPDTDPFSNSDTYALINQSQTVIDAIVGSANYDIGHTFSTGAGGLAYVGCVCNDRTKAKGVTGTSSPVGDPFDVDYVAHEMGHQLGANHTFNGTSANCAGSNRNDPTAYEPGSGSTIMAYAGICGADNLQQNSDPIFHSISYEEISDLVAGETCGSQVALDNSIPAAFAGPDHAIPIDTPFLLAGSGSDSDPGDALTYLWEERDLSSGWLGAALAAADDGQMPLFRIFTPTSSHARYFPRLETLAANAEDNAEKLPQLGRTMNFRLTVRDGSGGVDSDDVQVSVDGNSGPFRVTYPNDPVHADGGSVMTVTWDVAGTNLPPVDSITVDILLSTEGGLAWEGTPLLATSTPNDGSQAVTLPNIDTDHARVMVKGTQDIFFDISDHDLSISRNCAIEGPPSDPSCTDGVDNDCDGDIDGSDEDCLVCSGHGDCDDDNPCTDDECTAGLCSNVDNTAACDDADPCTANDGCSGGLCAGDPLDADSDGYVAAACGGNDCDDADQSINPGSRERLGDRVDNNCDGRACGAIGLGGNVSAIGLAANMAVLFGLPAAAIRIIRPRVRTSRM